MKPLTHLKIALVHDAFITYGGGERVINVIQKHFPQIDLFTSAIHPHYPHQLLLKNPHLTLPQSLAFITRKPRLIQLLSPFIWPTLHLSHYDLVISHGGFYLSHLISLKNPHLCHLHYAVSPPKNLYYPQHQHPFEKLLDQMYYPYLRSQDRKALNHTTHIATVSKEVASRFQKLYQIQTSLLYPPVTVPEAFSHPKIKKFFCYFGRLVAEKNLPVLIQAFNQNQLPLVIVGEGNQRSQLQQLAKPNITFLPFQPPAKLRQTLKQAIAYVHTGLDDAFPTAPIEALSSGVPVIAHHSGGITEVIEEGKTGAYFDLLTPESINQAINRFQRYSLDPHLCYTTATSYRESAFIKNLKKVMTRTYEQYRSRRHHS